jgi:membrane dipeptidase
MLRGLAKNGGTVQINFDCDYLSQRYYDEKKPLLAATHEQRAQIRDIPDLAQREAAEDKLDAEIASKITPPTLADVVAQIEHAVQIAGIDHVGIGTDFDGVSCVPSDLASYDKFPALTRALLEKGYTAQDIKKIYGGNLLRVMRAVEQRAHQLRNEPPIQTTPQTAQ